MLVYILVEDHKPSSSDRPCNCNFDILFQIRKVCGMWGVRCRATRQCRGGRRVTVRGPTPPLASELTVQHRPSYDTRLISRMRRARKHLRLSERIMERSMKGNEDNGWNIFLVLIFIFCPFPVRCSVIWQIWTHSLQKQTIEDWSGETPGYEHLCGEHLPTPTLWCRPRDGDLSGKFQSDIDNVQTFGSVNDVWSIELGIMSSLVSSGSVLCHLSSGFGSYYNLWTKESTLQDLLSSSSSPYVCSEAKFLPILTNFWSEGSQTQPWTAAKRAAESQPVGSNW